MRNPDDKRKVHKASTRVFCQDSRLQRSPRRRSFPGSFVRGKVSAKHSCTREGGTRRRPSSALVFGGAQTYSVEYSTGFARTPERRRSSGAERILGKDEVVSSILTGGTLWVWDAALRIHGCDRPDGDRTCNVRPSTCRAHSRHHAGFPTKQPTRRTFFPQPATWKARACIVVVLVWWYERPRPRAPDLSVVRGRWVALELRICTRSRISEVGCVICACVRAVCSQLQQTEIRGKTLFNAISKFFVIPSELSRTLFSPVGSRAEESCDVGARSAEGIRKFLIYGVFL